MSRKIGRARLAAKLGIGVGAAAIVGGIYASSSFAQAPPPPAAQTAQPAVAPPPTAPDTTKPPVDTAAPPAGLTAAPVIDAAAKTLLEQMVAAQQALNSYSATIETTLTRSGTSQKIQGEVSYEKPSMAFATITVPTGVKQTFVSDGTQRFALSSKDPNTYAKAPALAGTENIVGVVGPSRVSFNGVLPLLISQPTASDILLKGVSNLTKEADETVDGQPSDVVKAITPNPDGGLLTIIFATAKSDHLLRRVQLTLDDGKGNSGQIVEAYANVKANPTLASSIFSFKPGPGMKEAVPPPTKTAEQEQPKFDPRLKIGVNPLPFVGKDLNDKSVDLSALKGKVALIQFWATGSAASTDQIPQIVSVYQKYRTKKFDVIGVSLDDAGAHAKLSAFVKSHSMPWPQIYDGKSTQGTLAHAYGIKSIPFLLLVGKDGKIAAVNPSGSDLESAVKKALAK